MGGKRDFEREIIIDVSDTAILLGEKRKQMLPLI